MLLVPGTSQAARDGLLVGFDPIVPVLCKRAGNRVGCFARAREVGSWPVSGGGVQGLTVDVSWQQGFDVFERCSLWQFGEHFA